MERKDNSKFPDAALTTCVKRIMAFMETGDQSLLLNVFASQNVILLDSFAPYIFQGTNAAEQWAAGFMHHAQNIKNLRHTLGEAQEYSQTDKKIFFSQPIVWEGEVDGRSFYETGGLALMFVLENEAWRVQHYGWAATSFVLK